MLTVSIILIMRCFTKDKLEFYIHKTNYDISVKEHFELLDNLKRLTPCEMENLENSFKEWIENKKR